MTNTRNKPVITPKECSTHVKAIFESDLFARDSEHQEMLRKILQLLFQQAKGENKFDGTQQAYTPDQLYEAIHKKKVCDRVDGRSIRDEQRSSIRTAVGHLREHLKRYHSPAGSSEIEVTISQHTYSCIFHKNPFDACAVLWQGLVSNRKSLLIVFSNNVFLVNKNTGMFRYPPKDKSKEQDEELTHLYTGVGEVIAIRDITYRLAHLGIESQVKPAHRFSIGDLTDSNVVFVGSPFANEELDTLIEETWWKESSVCHYVWDNQYPRKVAQLKCEGTEGKNNSYELPSLGDNLSVTDFAHIFRTTTRDGTNILLLAGLGTYGTQSAANFICSASCGRTGCVQQFIDEGRMTRDEWRDGKPFEAILRVPVKKGVPRESKIDFFWKGA